MGTMWERHNYYMKDSKEQIVQALHYYDPYNYYDYDNYVITMMQALPGDDNHSPHLLQPTNK